MTEIYNNCAETHLGGGVMSPFVSLCSAIVWAHDPTVIGNVARRKGPRRFCPHRSDCCLALMLTCRNLLLWQGCECCNNVLSSFWPPWLAWTWSIEQRGHHVTCALIGTSHKLVAYNYTSGLALWTTLEYELVDANGYPKSQSRTCCQECGCHLNFDEAHMVLFAVFLYIYVCCHLLY